MTVPATEEGKGEPAEPIELPATETVQRALHEATGHLYDELAVGRQDADAEGEQLPADVFDALEALYVATAEESVTSVRISYERE
ncbi:hypothetical protein [Natronococcus wangiae]|uniref:hypothetical protein n=1 Tax=Natronococcus wangiae TaxID=3068275 RepID=UPI00273DB2B1|nr:hypothetical protein [Natronococcus sp. AD5]